MRRAGIAAFVAFLSPHKGANQGLAGSADSPFRLKQPKNRQGLLPSAHPFPEQSGTIARR